MYINKIPSRDELSLEISEPLVLVTDDGEEHAILAWSLDSVKRPETLPHRSVDGGLLLNFRGFSVGIPVRLAPGLDPARLYFLNLNSRQAELLRCFYRAHVSGQIEPVGDVIASMDLPVRDVQMHEADEDKARAPKVMRRWVRGALSVGFYLLLAMLVFGSLGYTAWARWNFVDMSNARLVAGDAGPAVQGWVNDKDITDTWIGMPAQVRLNVDGAVVSVDGIVIAMMAGSEAGVLAREGYLVQIALSKADTPDVVASLPSATPVDVILDRQLLKRVLP